MLSSWILCSELEHLSYVCRFSDDDVYLEARLLTATIDSKAFTQSPIQYLQRT